MRACRFCRIVPALMMMALAFGILSRELTSTDDEYEIEVVEQGEVFVFRFVKASPASLRYYVSFTGVNAGPFVLTKE